VNRLLTAHQHN